MLRLNIKTKISGFLLLISGAFAMDTGNPGNAIIPISRSPNSTSNVIPEGQEQTNDLLRQMLGEMKGMQTQITRLEGQLRDANKKAEEAQKKLQEQLTNANKKAEEAQKKLEELDQVEKESEELEADLAQGEKNKEVEAKRKESKAEEYRKPSDEGLAFDNCLNCLSACCLVLSV